MAKVVVLLGLLATSSCEQESSSEVQVMDLAPAGIGVQTDNLVQGMARVAAGPFMRGCQPGAPMAYCKDIPEDYVLLDVPYRQITLSEFWVDVYEATREEWNACVQAGACEHTPFTVPLEDRPGLPATDITWFAAEAYCNWRGKRLLTEAEWEKAARGTDGRSMPWGNHVPACNTINMIYSTDWGLPVECSGTGPEPVDAHPKDRSPYDVIGMGANVQEWTADWAARDYYAVAPAIDPPGPDEPDAGTHDYRIIRGTYWGADNPNTYRRWWFAPEEHNPRIGVRCGSSEPPSALDDPLAQP